MSCPSRDELWAWVHEEAEPDHARRVAIHVAACGSCTAVTDEMRELVDDLLSLSDPVEDAADEGAMPDRVGEYRIVRRLGAGGMGVVFEAEQQTPRRRVALKVLRSGHFADAFHVRLFQREMQTLARLNHPAIAAIYDAGRDDAGNDYFAMELVSGTPLDRFVAGDGESGNPRLGMRARLRLFQHIAAAISYAHQRGVIHRDLKPSNILVQADGTPKVLDFGLARMADADLGTASMAAESGRLIGTLVYMSPEQARGEYEAIDVRTDVYALGVLLYELLAEHLPQDVRRRPLHEAVKIICEQAPDALPADVPRDVRTIVAKALEKEPERRYQTAEALANDVGRYLNDYPITARPPSTLYRVRKAVVRHRLAVSLLTAIFLLVTGSAIGLGILAGRLADQRDAARLEADKFQRINDVLTGLLVAPNPWERMSVSQARETRVIDVLDSSAHRIESEFHDRPLLAAALRNTLGNTYRAIGELGAAERHLRYAAETRERELGGRHPETLDSRSDLAELLYERGELDAAEGMFGEVLAARRAASPQDRVELADSLNSVGLLLKQRGRLDEAEAHFREALERREAIAAALSEEAQASHKQRMDAYNALAQTKNNLAALYRARAALASTQEAALADLRLADPLYRDALALRREWLGPTHPEVAKMHNNYGKLLADLGAYDAAAENLRQSIEILRSELGPHPFTARALYNLAALHAERGAFGEAEPLAREARSMQAELLSADHPHLAETEALLERLARREP